MITTERASTSERPRFAISSRTRSSSSSPPTASAISLAACPLELLATALGSFVEACILDRDRRPFGQYHGGLFVALVEFAAALVCEVQVPVGLPADEDRHAQERRHRRMTLWEAVGARVIAHPREAQRMRVADQLPEHAVSSGEVADHGAPVCVYSHREEPLELFAPLVEYSERGVARAGEVPGRLEHPAQDHLEVELGDEAASDVKEPAQRDRLERRVHRLHFSGAHHQVIVM